MSHSFSGIYPSFRSFARTLVLVLVSPMWSQIFVGLFGFFCLFFGFWRTPCDSGARCWRCINIDVACFSIHWFLTFRASLKMCQKHYTLQHTTTSDDYWGRGYHMRISIYLRVHIYTYIRVYICTCIHSFIHTYIPTYLRTLHYITLHDITWHDMTLHDITWHYHSIPLHSIAMHCITLHYITLHTYVCVYIYILYIYNVYRCMSMYIYIYIYIYTFDVYTCMCIYIYVCVCACVYESIITYGCVYIVYIYMYIFIYLYTCGLFSNDIGHRGACQIDPLTNVMGTPPHKQPGILLGSQKTCVFFSGKEQKNNATGTLVS